MTRKVLDVGNCGPDFSSIKRMLTQHFDVEVLQAHGADDALSTVKQHPIDLVLVNRKLDRDYSDGTDVIKQLKADPETQSVPVMLVTNYEEHQAAAIELGALMGFGKLSLQEPDTIDRVRTALGA
ncbi:MAG TPA: response regulator [Planctomycetaceae bacterium]|nr:response regulator [Planctomycetaceae bacterium]